MTTKPTSIVPATKLRDVPPGEPPKGWRFLSRDEIVESGDHVFEMSTGEHSPAGRFVGRFMGELGSDVRYPYIRPIAPAAPQRGKQRKPKMTMQDDPLMPVDYPRSLRPVQPPASRSGGAKAKGVVGYCRGHILTSKTFDVLVSDQPEPHSDDIKILVLPLHDIAGLVEKATSAFNDGLSKDRCATHTSCMRAALHAIGIPASSLSLPRGKKGGAK